MLNIPPHLTSMMLRYLVKCKCQKYRPTWAAHLRHDGLYNNRFITNLIILFAGERVFKIDEQLATLQTKCVIVLFAPLH